MNTSEASSGSTIVSQEQFLKTLCLEQKRTERSRRRFILMLLEANGRSNGHGTKTLEQIVDVLSKSTRQTDVIGWYRDGLVIGTIFTEIGAEDARKVAKSLLDKFTRTLAQTFSSEEIQQIAVSLYVFPDDWEDHTNGRPTSTALYPNSLMGSDLGKATLRIKRVMDIAGSLCALVLCAPLLTAIAISIKLNSKGPVIFKQRRVGQYGRPFTFLKFRSMYTENDPRIHQEFVTRFINGENGNKQNGQHGIVFKLTNDPRVTPVGSFLRRTSLDELPQFFNVLRGEMSLVGPRPPIPYEFDSYDIWHRRRLLGVKPGITGLWQVTARSRVGFADMVRLDLKYAQTHSLWLDLKILLRTPLAVVGGDGAH